MSLLAIAGLERRFAERVIFRDVTFRLARGDRAGLVGPNGCGKTTLLRVLAGELEPDAGSVARARGARVGLLRQELLLPEEGTVLSCALAARERLDALEAEMRALEARLDDPAALAAYGELAASFEHAGGYDFEGQMAQVLGGLGFGPADRERPLGTLSGGERTRLGLARLLLEDPDLLLLDEPTNHLDLDALEWLERFLLERERTLLVASHDRYFLDRVTARTLAFAQGTARAYRGGYGAYARQRDAELVVGERAHERQRAEIARQEAFIERERAGQRARQARGRRKQLARLERVAAVERRAAPKWRLAALPLGSAEVLATTPLVVGPVPEVRLLRTSPLRVPQGARLAIVGPNGSGKTTLLRTLLGELWPLEGHVRTAPGARAVALAQSQEELLGGASVLEAFREGSGWSEHESRDLLARFLFRGEEVFREIGALSGGERSRLALARLAARPANVLALDEPTNHLDVEAREALEAVLAAYEGTVIFVTHDRYLVDRLATHTWLASDGAVRACEGGYSAMRAALSAERAESARASAIAPRRKVGA